MAVIASTPRSAESFDRTATGLLWDPTARLWHPTVERPCPYPTVEAENGHMVLDRRDWSAGTLIIGDKETGKSSVMLRHYLNAIQDAHGAVVLIDPKRTLALRAVAITPRLCGKRVWYLDLSRPAFGMSMLRMNASKQAIANVVVAALRDVFPEQVFQASREVIEKCVLAALALADAERRPARVEDVFRLMVWENRELRERAVAACSRIPNGDRVRDYLTIELAGEMQHNTSSARERLRAPRNKLDALLQADSLRVFFNHTTEKPLEEIVADRDVLIVDAHLGDGGEENSQLMIAFVLHMLDSVLKRQQGVTEERITRVHLFIDEGGHVLNEHVMRMQDSHREVGFTLIAAMHYMDQLDPAVLSGALNMLANKYVFRIGKRRDAEELCDDIRGRVYSNPRTAGRARVWPEALQELRNLRCLVSWLVDGEPDDVFLGRPYPMPPVSAVGWRRHWLSWLQQQVGSYPEHILWTLRDAEATTQLVEAPTNGAQREHVLAGVSAETETRSSAAGVERLRDSARLANAALLKPSRARLVVGAFASPGIDPEELPAPAPPAIAELHMIEQIRYRGREPIADEDNAPLPRINDRDLSALSALDRLGFLTAELIGRASYPGRTVDAVQRNLKKLARAGLVSRYPVQMEGQRGGRSTCLYALTAKGLHVGQHPPKGRRPSIDERRQHRPSAAVEGKDLRHDLLASSWLIAFLRAFLRVTSNNWRTPRYHSGHLDVPTMSDGRRGERRPLTMLDAERALEEHYCFVDVQAAQKIAPDLSIELRPSHDGKLIVTDLLVEVDNTGKPDHNAPKFRAYDSLLCGWGLSLTRYQKLGSRPFALFVCPNIDAMRALMRRADQEMTGGVGIKGTADPSRWYYAGRDHVAFTTIELIHYGLPTAWMLPPYPPQVREQLRDVDGYKVTPVSLLDPSLVDDEARIGWELPRVGAVKETG